MTAPPTTRRLAGGAVVLLAVRTAGLVMGVAVTVLLARGMERAAFGTFATGLALAHIGTSFTEFGLSGLLVRESSARPAASGALLAWATRARLIAGAIVALVLAGVSMLLVDDRAGRLAVLVVIATVPISAFTLGISLLQQRLQLGRIARLLLVQSALWLAIVAALYVAAAGPLSYAIGYLCYTAAYGVLVHRATRRALAGPGEAMALREFASAMRDVVPLSVTAVLITLYYKLDSVFVYQFAGDAAAGSYAIAYRFLDQLQIVPVTLATVFLPLMTRRHAAGEQTTPTVDRYLRLSLLLCAPVAAVGILAAQPLVVGVFGAQYAGAVVLLRLLLLAFVPVALGYVLSYTAIVHRQSSKQLRAAGVALAGNVALNLLLVPRYGAPAAAALTVLTEVAVVVMLYRSLRVPCGLRLPWGWLQRFAGVLAVASAAGWVAGAALHPIVGAAVFCAAYAVAAVGSGVVDGAEIRSLVRPRADESAEPVEQSAHLVAEAAGLEH